MKKLIFTISSLFAFAVGIQAQSTTTDLISLGEQVTDVTTLTSENTYVIKVVNNGGTALTTAKYITSQGHNQRAVYKDFTSTSTSQFAKFSPVANNNGVYTITIDELYLPSFSGGSGGFNLTTDKGRANDQYTFESVTEKTNTYYMRRPNGLYLSFSQNGTNSSVCAIDDKDTKAAQVQIYKVNIANQSVIETNIKNLITTANDLQSHVGKVGYPKSNGTITNNLAAAITTATSTKSISTYASLNKAVNAFYNAGTNDVLLPESGKAYTITVVSNKGKKVYMNYTENGYQLVEKSDNAALPQTATLICRQLSDGKYAFVNNAGKYFIWKGSDQGSNNKKGYQDTYDANETFTISKISTGSYVSGNNSDLVGKLFLKGKRHFVIKFETTPASYDQADAPFYNDKHSSALLIEEVAYPNTVTFKEEATVEGVGKVATFSAPFATVIPEGVKAYTVSSIGNDAATLKEISTAIPANTGVVLVANEATTATMLPVTDEIVATVEGNLLNHSAGAAHTVTTSDNAYILAKDGDAVAFYTAKEGTTLAMNKAYLSYAGTRALSLNFAGAATSINTVLWKANDNAPLFDLSGRRIFKAQKGALYIQNGKKLIAK